MTPEESITLAKEAGFLHVHTPEIHLCSGGDIQRFSDLVVAQERDRCAINESLQIIRQHYKHDAWTPEQALDRVREVLYQAYGRLE